MPRIVEYITTPNPHALKCVLDTPPTPLADTDKVRSYRDASSAAADPLAAKLFAIEGVRNILIVNNWITVGKADAASWKTLKPALERALA